MLVPVWLGQCKNDRQTAMCLAEFNFFQSRANSVPGIPMVPWGTSKGQGWPNHYPGCLGAKNACKDFVMCSLILFKANQIPKQEVLKVVQCIWMSKLRYWLQLCNQVRLNSEGPVNAMMSLVQGCQNKMLHMLDNVSLKDHVTSISILHKYKLQSVNQLSAEIKLIEAWKSINVDSYPI